MVFVRTEKRGNNVIYKLAHNIRVGKKVKRAWEFYLGTENTIQDRLSVKEGQKPIIKSLKFGYPAALYDIAKELTLIEIIDKNTNKKRKQGWLVGQYFLIMAINRCVKPKSKNKIGKWMKKTVIPQIMKVDPNAFTSQSFWNHMNYINSSDIENIERDICRVLIDKFDLKLEKIFYDPTNFATFIQEHEDRGNKIVRFGNNKRKRFDLRQVNVALLVTADFEIPLMHETYEGNMHDSKKFPDIISKLTKRFKIFSKNVKRITVVFDKGNNSKKNMEQLDDTPYYFVGSLKPYNYKDFFNRSWAEFDPIYEKDDKEIVYGYRFKKKVLGAERTIVVIYEEKLSRKNRYSLLKKLGKKLTELSELNQKIGSPKCKTEETIQKKLSRILNAYAPTKKLLWGKLKNKEGNLSLIFGINNEEFAKREKQFGKTIIFTNNHYWTTKDIVKAYRSKGKIEECFKKMNDPEIVTVDPKYHWTDQKITAHVFGCVLGLLLTNLLKRTIHLKGLTWSTQKIIEELKNIEMPLYKFLSKNQWKKGIPSLSKDQKKIYDLLNLDKYF